MSILTGPKSYDVKTQAEPIAPLRVIPSSDQKAMSQDLMEEIRALISADKYNHLNVSTVIGVLEMTKMHYYEACP